VEQTTIRVVLPEQFQTEEKWKEARKRPAERMAEWTTGQMHTEGWQFREDERTKYMIGYAKIPQEEITTMIAKSGQKNAYLQRLARGNPPVQDTAWMRREKDETDSDCGKSEAKGQ